MTLETPVPYGEKSTFTSTFKDSTTNAKLVADSSNKSPAPGQQQADDAADDAMLKKQGFPTVTIATPQENSQTDSTSNQIAAPADQNGSVSTDTVAGASTASSASTNASESKLQGAINVAKDLGKGVLTEVDDHPGRLALDAAIGIGTGAVATVALASAPVWAPIGLGVETLGFGIYEAYQNLPGIYDEAKVAAQPEDYTPTQVTQATNQLQQLGGKAADVAAGSLGGVDGAAFGSGIVKGLASSAVSGAVSSLDAQAAQDTAQDASKALTNDGAKDVTPAKTETASAANESGSENRTPEQRAKILNQLANGSIDNIKQETDTGLNKNVIRGTAKTAGGSTDAFIRKIDPDSKTDLERIRKAQTETNVDKVTGQDTHAPLTVLRSDVAVDGQPQLLAVQEDAGKSLGANLKDWAANAYGAPTPDNVQKLIEAHPALKQSVGGAMFQMLYKGNTDFMELSNLAVRGTQNGAEVSLDKPLQIPIIDAKYNWTTDTASTAAGQPQTPNWGVAMSINEAMPAKVADLYAGKKLSDISPQLQQQAEALQQFYQSPAGQTQLQKAGLSPAEISAAASRLQYLTTEGFPPMPTPDSPAFDKMLDELGTQSSYYSDRSQSASLPQILDTQKQEQSPG